MDRSRTSFPTLLCMAAVLLLLVILSSSWNYAEAYAFAPSPSSQPSSKLRYAPVVNSGRRIHKCREDGSSVTLYLFLTTPSSQTPPMAAANLLQSSRSRRMNSSGSDPRGNISPPLMRPKTKLAGMSQSVLATCDTLPAFSTAHGLLSPEVVTRIADRYDLEQNGALCKFLNTYRSRGPMACLPMLSDPNVLPALTKAMRDIA